MAHGLLFYHRLIKEPKLFYCPGNNNPMLQYAKLPPNPANRGGGWPRGSIPDDLGPNQSWVQTTYHYRSLWDEKKWRAVNPFKDSDGMAFMADMFSDPSRGVQYHHENGYNVAFVDGHSEFIKDLEHKIQEFGGGQPITWTTAVRTMSGRGFSTSSSSTSLIKSIKSAVSPGKVKIGLGG